MSKEEFYEPNEEEIERVVTDAEKQMKEYYDSLPTNKNVNKVIKEVARQFKNGSDKEVEEEEIIDAVEKYEKEGWDLVDIINNAASVSAQKTEGKDIKIVGLGKKFLVFEKRGK